MGKLLRVSMQPDSKTLRTKEAEAQREDPGSFHAYELLSVFSEIRLPVYGVLRNSEVGFETV